MVVNPADYELNTNRILRIYSLIDLMREPIIWNAIRELKILLGSRGLDAGCGIGSNTLLLAEAVAAGGHVTGLDLSFEFISVAEKRAQKAGCAGKVTFQQGDVRDIPFEENTFDWAWSMDLVGYASMDMLPLLRELIRVIKPGGKLAVLAWSSEELLPGHPRLEARLSATNSGIAPFVHGNAPKTHFLRTLGWFKQSGLIMNKAQTFIKDVQAPLDQDTKLGLQALFEMRWSGVESELSEDDLDEYQQFVKPGSPDFILNEPDYYAFFTYTMFTGEVPG